jgi:ribose 5-phosphate isomerase B
VPRAVLTARDLEPVPAGGEVVVTPDTLITPLAQEEAQRRGIHIRVVEPSAQVASRRDRVVALGADHRGFELKEQLKNHLRQWGYGVLDLGTGGPEAVDYPDFADAVARAVVQGKAWRGVVIDSVGIGSAIVANKVPGVRAALCYDGAAARSSREHNDANVLSFGAQMMRPDVAREVLAVWLETPFAGGRHEKRLEKIRAIEQRYAK